MSLLGLLHFKLPVLALLLVLAVGGPASAVSSPDVLKVPSSGPTDTKIKSYREWKSERIQEAISRITVTRTQLQITKSKDPNLSHHKSGGTEANSGVSLERLESQLQDDQIVLENAKNFSVTDYLAGYLMKIQNKKAAFNEVAGKLTAEEIAELMSAYANSAFGNHSSDLAPSANNASEDRVR
jgi:hypothetical protein